MKGLRNILMLVAAGWVGTMVYKYQHAVPTVTGEGSVVETFREAHDNPQNTESRLSGNFTGGLGNVGNRPAGGLGSVGSSHTNTSMMRNNATGAMQPQPASSNRSGDPKNDMALLEAAALGDVKAVDARLAQNLKVDSRDTLRRTPLMYASWSGNADIITRLLAAGANPSLQDRDGSNAFDYAAGRGLTDTVQMLLKYTKGKDDRHYIEYATILNATFAGDIGRLPAGQDRLASINRVNPEGYSPLHIAAGNGSTALMEELIRRGANVNLANRQGQTPVYWAAWNNQPASIELLAARGADIKRNDSAGDTPLILAVQNNSKEAVKLLLAKGADKYVANKNKQTALIIAQNKGYHDLADLLK